MSRILSSLQAVLWALIGLGGRQTNADRRMEQGSLAWVLVSVVLVVFVLVGGLLVAAKLAAGQ